jgi:hypothetical protein
MFNVAMALEAEDRVLEAEDRVLEVEEQKQTEGTRTVLKMRQKAFATRRHLVHNSIDAPQWKC